MSDISVRAGKTFLNEDQRWIGPGGISAMPDARSITLDRALFDLAVAFPNGFIPSGVSLGKVTATGRYGKYDDAAVNGLEVCAGFLLASVSLDLNSTGRIGAALYWHGEVVEAFLPAGHGLNAAGKVDLAAKFAFI